MKANHNQEHKTKPEIKRDQIDGTVTDLFNIRSSYPLQLILKDVPLVETTLDAFPEMKWTRS